MDTSMKGSLYLEFILLLGRLYVGEWCGVGHFHPNATVLDLGNCEEVNFGERVTASRLYIILWSSVPRCVMWDEKFGSS